MKITYERVEWFDVRNFIGFDAAVELIRAYDEHIRNSSVIWLGKLDGIEVAAGGLISTSLFSDTGYVWFVNNDLCRRHSVYFMLWSKLVLRDMFELYPNIVGFCRCDNEPAQKWMRWLGAEIDTTVKRIPKIPGDHFSFRITRP